MEDLTSEERNAIAALQRLAKRWPPSLMLLSMDGNLEVVRSADWQQLAGADELPERIIATIDGIPNDGGAW